ncbi:lipocalin family protein [Winogradskyella sp. 3972H.M.0a.05]|uniref:lipocalin family protein n=1 Tax=Winogradskyella sp. 3972H.M.0a.05 TaxID=2950277 RepID=UPI00339AB9AB
MKRWYYLLFVFLFQCSDSPEDMIPNLSGYWEIEKVVLPDGTERTYSISLTIDYISINDSLKGFRKKLKPNLDGSYEASDDIESLELKTVDNKLLIEYTTALSTWTERVLKAEENVLHLKNDANTTYIYKRYEPLNITHEQT